MNTSRRTAKSFAPGRIEIIGNHTDYNQGFVLSCALPQGVEAFVEQIESDNIFLNFTSDLAPEEFSFSAFTEPQATPGAWTNYPLGVIKYLREEGLEIPPCRIQFTSNLPAGAGLSSSAAIEIATATALLALSGTNLPPMDLARLCRRAENEFVGVNCGLLDQATSICGKAGHLLHLDFRSETYELYPLPPGHLFLVIPSGMKHSLVGGEYNERRTQCYEAARVLNVRALRDATFSALEAAADQMPEMVFRRARHIIGENQRVAECVAALQNNDMVAFGQAMTNSHQSSRLYFENSTEELDNLFEIAVSTPGVLGARLTGGGFGGAVVALAKASKASDAAKTIATRYLQRTGIHTTATPYVPADGARLLPTH